MTIDIGFCRLAAPHTQDAVNSSLLMRDASCVVRERQFVPRENRNCEDCEQPLTSSLCNEISGIEPNQVAVSHAQARFIENSPSDSSAHLAEGVDSFNSFVVCLANYDGFNASWAILAQNIRNISVRKGYLGRGAEY